MIHSRTNKSNNLKSADRRKPFSFKYLFCRPLHSAAPGGGTICPHP